MTSLPIINRPLDNTALATFMECPKKYEYSMIRHRRERKGRRKSPSLTYGTAWHALLDAHYRTGGDKAAAIEAAGNAWEDHGKEGDHRTFERLCVEYDNYISWWGMPSEEEAKTVGWPEAPLIEVVSQIALPKGLHPYAVKLDRFIKINNHYYVEDHKTTSALGPSFFQQFELDNQMMGYAFVGSLLIGQPVAGVRINAHAVLKTSSKFERQVIPFSQPRLEQWRDNYNFWVEALERAIVSGIFPNNWKSCSGKYGMCQYAEICSLPPHLRVRALEQDFEESAWNPLEEPEPIGEQA